MTTQVLNSLISQIEALTLTYASAATYIGTDQSYVRRLVSIGVLKKVRVHKTPLVTLASVKAYVDEREARLAERAERQALVSERPRHWAPGLNMDSVYATWTLPQLRNACRERGLPCWLNKAHLVDALERDDVSTVKK